MTEAEAYVELIEALRGSSVPWIADQIEDEVERGRTVSKTVDSIERDAERGKSDSQADLLYPGEPPPARPSRGRPRQKMTSTVAYTPEERFLIALHAVRTVLVDTVDMEAEALGNLRQAEDGKRDGPLTMEFASDRNIDSPPRVIGEDRRPEAKALADRAREAFDLLLGER